MERESWWEPVIGLLLVGGLLLAVFSKATVAAEPLPPPEAATLEIEATGDIIEANLTNSERLKERFVSLYTLLEPTALTIESYNPNLSKEEKAYILERVIYWSNRRDLNLSTVMRMIARESRFNPMHTNLNKDLSTDHGLMQINSNSFNFIKGLSDCEDKGFDAIYEIDFNLCLGTAYMEYHLNIHGNEDEALFRYNGSRAYIAAVRNMPLEGDWD